MPASTAPDPAPWADAYPPGVPAAYGLPEVRLPRLLDDALRDAPHELALVAGDRTLDHRQLHRVVQSLAVGLARAGVAEGDRVLVAVDGRLALPVTLLAAWRLGVVVVLRDPATVSDVEELVSGGVVAVIATRRVLRRAPRVIAGGDRELLRIAADGDRWVVAAGVEAPARRRWWRRAGSRATATPTDDPGSDGLDDDLGSDGLDDDLGPDRSDDDLGPDGLEDDPTDARGGTGAASAQAVTDAASAPSAGPTGSGSAREGGSSRPLDIGAICGQATGTALGPLPPVVGGPQEVAVEVAGDDGRPLTLTHRQLLATAFQTRLWVPDIQAAQERIFVPEPLRDLRLLAAGWLMGLLSAATVVLGDSAQPEPVAEEIAARSPTLLVASGRVLRALLDDEAALRGRSLASLRVLLTVGRPLDAPQVAAGERRTRGARIRALGGPIGVPLPVWGQPVYGRVPPGASGLPLTDTHLRLCDDAGQPVATGTIGRVEVRGPQVAGRGGADGWRTTSTLAAMDEHGVVRAVGEVADALHRPGGLVGPDAAEAHLRAHPELVDAALVRRGDATTGGWVAAVVRRRRGRPTDEDLRAHCAGGPDGAEAPQVFVSMDTLPRTPIGTVDRPALRARLAAPVDPASGESRPATP